MKQELFRKVSLERLSSPEQLDKLISVTTPRAWLALVAIAFLLITAVFWGIWGSIPTKVEGQGILIKGGGIFNVVHSAPGQITDIKVAAGDRVKAGDVVTRIDQPEFVRKITEEKKRLQQLVNLRNNRPTEGENLPTDLYEVSSKINIAKSAIKTIEADYRSNLEKGRVKLELAGTKAVNQRAYVEKLTRLFNGGAISENELTQAKKDLDLYELDLREARESLEQLNHSFNASIAREQRELDLLQGNIVTMLAETGENIKKLRDEMDSGSSIVTQISGRVLEVKVNRGDMVQPGMPLMSLEREGKTVKLEVVMYVKAEEGKKILPGMEAQVSPTTVKKEEYGYMLGKVVSVSEYPSTTQGMRLVLGNDELAAKLAGQGAPLEVRIDVIADESSFSGYKWSSSQGPPLKINSGTLCSGSVTVSRQRPVSMIIPTLKKALLQ